MGGLPGISRFIRAWSGICTICRSFGNGGSATATGGCPKRNHASTAIGNKIKHRIIPHKMRPIFLHASTGYHRRVARGLSPLLKVDARSRDSAAWLVYASKQGALAEVLRGA